MTTPPNASRADPFDISDFQPAPAAKPKTDTEKVRQVSEANNFPSRAPAAKPVAVAAPPEPRPQRRHRTGRNVQFNIKATAETIERFTKLSDANGWVFGETLSRALDALEETLKSNKATG